MKTAGTVLTVLDGELDFDNLGVTIVNGRSPTDAAVTFGTGGARPANRSETDPPRSPFSPELAI